VTPPLCSSLSTPTWSTSLLHDPLEQHLTSGSALWPREHAHPLVLSLPAPVELPSQDGPCLVRYGLCLADGVVTPRSTPQQRCASFQELCLQSVPLSPPACPPINPYAPWLLLSPEHLNSLLVPPGMAPGLRRCALLPAYGPGTAHQTETRL